MARPFGTTKLEFNDQLLNEWRGFGKIGLKFNVIAKIKCVTPATISEYHKRHPELILAYDEGLSVCEKTLKNKAMELAESGDLDAIKYVNKHLNDWKDTNHVKGEGIAPRTVVLIRNEQSLLDTEKALELGRTLQLEAKSEA